MGDVVIISFDYNLNTYSKISLCDITEHNICQVIRNRYYSTGIVITPNNTLTKIYISNDDENKKYLNTFPNFCNSILYKYSLVFLYDDKNDKTQLNKMATRIHGKKKIYGDCIILHEVQDKILGHLSMNELNILNKLSYGRIYDREKVINKPVEQPQPVDNKIQQVIVDNRYVIVNNLKKQLQYDKLNCCYCNDLVNDNPIFFGDYCRGVVCSDDCFKKIDKNEY